MSDRQIYALTAATPDSTCVIPFQVANGATEAEKVALSTFFNTFGIPTTKKISLTSAEILALNTTPKELIAAPGAGYYIRVIGFTCVLNYNSVAYSGNAMVIHHTGSSANLLSSSFYTIGAEYMTFINPSSPSNATLTIIENSSLIAEVGSANPTSGNSTVDIYVTYSIIPV